MKRIELQKQYRNILASNHHLRCLVGTDLMVHQQTIQRWANNNSPKLVTDFFIDSFKKHAIIDAKTPVTELVNVESKHLQDN